MATNHETIKVMTWNVGNGKDAPYDKLNDQIQNKKVPYIFCVQEALKNSLMSRQIIDEPDIAPQFYGVNTSLKGAKSFFTNQLSFVKKDDSFSSNATNTYNGVIWSDHFEFKKSDGPSYDVPSYIDEENPPLKTNYQKIIPWRSSPWILLTEKQTKYTYAVISVHLQVKNKKSHYQIYKICEDAKKYEEAGYRVIIGGDFNMSPIEIAYALHVPYDNTNVSNLYTMSDKNKKKKGKLMKMYNNDTSDENKKNLNDFNETIDNNQKKEMQRKFTETHKKPVTDTELNAMFGLKFQNVASLRHVINGNSRDKVHEVTHRNKETQFNGILDWIFISTNISLVHGSYKVDEINDRFASSDHAQVSIDIYNSPYVMNKDGKILIDGDECNPDKDGNKKSDSYLYYKLSSRYGYERMNRVPEQSEVGIWCDNSTQRTTADASATSPTGPACEQLLGQFKFMKDPGPNMFTRIYDENQSKNFVSVNAGSDGLFVGGAGINERFKSILTKYGQQDTDKYTEYHKHIMNIGNNVVKKVNDQLTDLMPGFIKMPDFIKTTYLIKNTTIPGDDVNSDGGRLVILHIFKEEIGPYKKGFRPYNNHNIGMLYVVAPSTNNAQFLDHIKVTAKNINKVIKTYNDDEKNAEKIQTIRVCLFGGAIYKPDHVTKESVANSILSGLGDEINKDVIYEFAYDENVFCKVQTQKQKGGNIVDLSKQKYLKYKKKYMMLKNN